MTTVNYRRVTSALIAAWFSLSIAASALHAFRTDAGGPPLVLGLAVLSPIAVFSL